MSLWDEPVRDVRPLATDEWHRLVVLLDGLSADEWLVPSAAPGWTVKDLALHLLDDDLTWLSRARDADRSGLVDMSDRAAFAGLLAAKNQRWLDGARSLSQRVVTDLLAWTGAQIDAFHADADLRAEGWVSWASDGPVPYWFNLAQELTERWVHQQQVREAVGRLDDHAALLPEVLRTFAWALPHQLHAPADAGAEVEVTLGEAGVWTLVADGAGRWALTERPAGDDPLATLRLSTDAAWRALTGAAVPADGVRASGPPALVERILRVRGIIA